MGRVELVGSVPPGFSGIEGDPDIGEFSRCDVDLGDAVVGDEIGEGLIQPEVVPPLHGDEVSEPVVSHLVGDGICESSQSGGVNLFSEDVEVVEGDEASIFHCSSVVLRAEDLVVLAEVVGGLEIFLVELHTLVSDLKHEISHSLQMDSKTLSGIETHGEVLIVRGLGGNLEEWTSDESEQVGGKELGDWENSELGLEGFKEVIELSDSGGGNEFLKIGSGGIGVQTGFVLIEEHNPIRWTTGNKSDSTLKIWLIETGENFVA